MHTPGPWKADIHRNGGASIYRDPHVPGRDYLIANCTTYPNQKTNAANARLIAQAPAMLAFVKAQACAGHQVAAHDRGCHRPGTLAQAVCAEARAILRAVEG